MTTLEKIKAEIDEQTEIHSDGEFYIKNIDVKRILAKYAAQEPCENCCNGNQIEKAKLCQKSYLAGMEHKQEPCDVTEYDKDHIWYKGCQYISLRRFLEVKAEAEKKPCEDCDYSEIMDWEQDAKTGKAKPIYWCERHKEPCEKNHEEKPHSLLDAYTKMMSDTQKPCDVCSHNNHGLCVQPKKNTCRNYSLWEMRIIETGKCPKLKKLFNGKEQNDKRRKNDLRCRF